MAVIWYGLVPMAGALVNRYKWHRFRKRFDELRLRPILDYNRYSQQGKNKSGEPASFRFVGGFESVTDRQTLWIRSEDLTIPVSLKNAETYLLPMQKHEGLPDAFDPGEEALEKISWERVSVLTEGARVFVGGFLAFQDGRWSFMSTRENPLMVIFYDGPDQALAGMVTRAGRHRGDYWNSITPYSLVMGVLCQILMAVLFIPRPAFRLTVITSFVALFIPLYPLIPPGLLFAVIHRRLGWKSRILRITSSIARLPLCYLAQPGSKTRGGLAPLAEQCQLPDGELYGFTRIESQEALAETAEKIPLLLTEFAKAKAGRHSWLAFGALRPSETMPCRPQDPFASFGILPEMTQKIARQRIVMAYALEILAWLILLAGIGLNIFFLSMVLAML